MTDLSAQKRMAADVMDVGESRVWIDPERTGDVADAITKQDIRNLIESGVIEKQEKAGTSRGRARQRDAQRAKGRQQGHGSRKGTQGARKSDKDAWKEKIRALRSELRRRRDDGDLDSATYRELYDKASGGFFRNKKHMELYIEKHVE